MLNLIAQLSFMQNFGRFRPVSSLQYTPLTARLLCPSFDLKFNWWMGDFRRIPVPGNITSDFRRHNIKWYVISHYEPYNL